MLFTVCRNGGYRDQQVTEDNAAVTHHHRYLHNESVRERGNPPCQPLSSRYATISNMTASPTPTNALTTRLPTLTNTPSSFAATLTPANPQILTLPQCFPSLPSHPTEEMEELENVNKISRIVIFSHQNIVCFLLLNPSAGLPARMRREYIVGSVGNNNWRSSTSPKVVIGQCRCWNRAS